MNIKTIVGLVVVVMTGYMDAAPNCTAFCLNNEQNLFVGKNLDWPVADGVVLVNPRNITKKALPVEDVEPLQWTSRYGSITFNQFGLDFPLGGMNEAGLVVEELSYSPSQYPAPDARHAVAELQWIQYQLDNFSSVTQVIESDAVLRPAPYLFHLHFFVADASGRCAVVEFLDGKRLCYTDDQLPVAVLSNNSYENSLNYLAHHVGFGGDRIVSNGPESQERFVRAASLIQNAPDSAGIDVAFEILKNVSQHDTQWSIVYDLDRHHIFFSFRQSSAAFIDLHNVDFSLSSAGILCDLYPQQPLSVNTTLAPYTDAQHAQLVKRVFQHLVDLDEVDAEDAERFILELTDYVRN